MSKTHPTAREVFVSAAFQNGEDRLSWEEKFFERLCLSNGLVKTTSAHRLDDVNAHMLKCIQGLWSDEVLQVPDVGVSSGITTIELAEALRGSGRSFKMVGTDLCIDASVLSYGRHLHVLCDRQGRALQFELRGFPISNYLGTGMWSWLRRIVPVFFARALFGLLSLLSSRRFIGPPVPRSVRLLTGYSREDPDVKFVQEDLFAETSHGSQYHLIRAANILNPRNFSAPELHRAIDLLRGRLKVGGFLIIVRSHDDGTNHGACYELQNDLSFREVVSLGDGCEINLLVLELATVLRAKGLSPQLQIK